jgi:hypothetical protein
MEQSPFEKLIVSQLVKILLWAAQTRMPARRLRCPRFIFRPKNFLFSSFRKPGGICPVIGHDSCVPHSPEFIRNHSAVRV